jgi:PTS system glucitol/sorbitol-specific IIA component
MKARFGWILYIFIEKGGRLSFGADFGMAVIYQTSVKSLGACVNSFDSEKMFVLFGSEAPDTLKDYCYEIDVRPIYGEIKLGQTAVIDGKPYQITAVGKLVKRNLEALGHVTFSFTGATQAELPGTIYLEESPVPRLHVDSTVEIRS